MVDTIRVYANPHHAHDRTGEGQAAVPFVDESGRLHLHRFVGASYDFKRSGAVADKSGRLHARKLGFTHVDEKTGAKSKHGEGRVVFAFSSEPQTVPFEGPAKDYYTRKVLDGELLAADEESAKACGVKDFGPPKCDACAKRELDAKAKAAKAAPPTDAPLSPKPAAT